MAATAEITKFEFPKFKTPAQIYGANIEKETQAAALMLQKVAAVTTVAEKFELEGYIKNAKKVRKAGADLRLEETRKLDAVKTAYTSREKDFFADLDARTTGAEKLINDFNAAELAKVRAEQKRLAEEEAARVARLRSPVSMAKVETEYDAKRAAVAADLPTGVRMAWTWEVADVKALPAEFIYSAIQAFIDEKGQAPEFLKLALDNFVKTGGRNMPGVRIEEKPIRTGR